MMSSSIEASVASVPRVAERASDGAVNGELVAVDTEGALALDMCNAEVTAARERDSFAAAADRALLILPDGRACDDVELLASDRCGSLGRGCGGLQASARGPCDGGRLRCGCTTTSFSGAAAPDSSVEASVRSTLALGASASRCGGRDACREARLLAPGSPGLPPSTLPSAAALARRRRHTRTSSTCAMVGCASYTCFFSP